MPQSFHPSTHHFLLSVVARLSTSNLRPSEWLISGVFEALLVINFVLFMQTLLSLFPIRDNFGRAGGINNVDDRRFSGLDKSVIDSLPVFCFPGGGGNRTTTSECAVCLSLYEGGTEKLRLLPNCGHAFHVTCSDPWLEGHSSCPLCRTKVDNVCCNGVSVVFDDSCFRVGNEGGEAPVELVVEREPGVSIGALRLSIRSP